MSNGINLLDLSGSYPRHSDRSIAWEFFLANIARIGQLCQEWGIEIGVETMYVTPDSQVDGYLLDTLDSMLMFRQAMPEIKWVLDLAHLNMKLEKRSRFTIRIVWKIWRA